MATPFPTPLSHTDENAFRLRIATVYAGLTANGIDARQRSRCCTTCAVAEMPPHATWAYYHEQDDERIGSGVLWVGFGAPSDAETLQVGHALVVLGVAQGLGVVWDGTTGSKVVLQWTGAPTPIGGPPDRPTGRPDADELCECGWASEDCDCECECPECLGDPAEYDCTCGLCGHLLLDCLCDE